MPTFKLGRKRSVLPEKRLKLVDYVKKEALPTPPTDIDYSETPAVASALSEMYLNDTLGDCVIAGMCHSQGVFSGNAGSSMIFSPEQVTSLYSAIGGYVPGDPSTDNGCDIQTMLLHWRHKGAPFEHHRTKGSLFVNPSSAAECQLALWLFENLIFGVELPDAWADNMPSESGFVWDVAGPADPNNGHCFTVDTKVSLLDGRDLTFGELATGIAGDSFWVYSCDSSGNVVPGKAHSPRKTRTKVRTIEVVLDNNKVVKCTPDHPFLLRNGTYKKACELTPGSSLMPLYRAYDDNGYESFFNPRTQTWRSTYNTVCRSTKEVGPGMVIHHYDFDKRNNSPDNLLPMTKSDHVRLHQETSKILVDYAKSTNGRAKSKQVMLENWTNPVWCEKMLPKLLARVSSMGKANILGGGGFASLEKDILVELCRTNGLNSIPRLASKGNQAKAAEGQRQSLVDNPNLREKKRIVAIKNLELANSGPLTKKQIEARRNNITIAREAQARIRLDRRQSNTTELVNHKVVEVREGQLEDVYDMSVDTFNNFALSSGVFVHNCFVGVGYNPSQIKISTWGMTGLISNGAAALYAGQSEGGELYSVLSPNILSAALKKAPNGIDWAQLQTDFQNF